jgi:hypothetical protein
MQTKITNKKQAFEGMRSEMSEAAKNHRKIASNIRELVVSPFARWCDAHAARVQNSQDDLQARIKAHDRQADYVRTYRSQYYNKCRRVEDLDEEEKLAFQDPLSEAAQSPKPVSQIPVVKLSEPEEEDDPEPIDIGDQTYTPEQVKKILNHILETVKLGETKVPILGTYHNVSTGADITDYIQKHMGGTSVSYAERIGQDMVGHGFLRLVRKQQSHELPVASQGFPNDRPSRETRHEQVRHCILSQFDPRFAYWCCWCRR